MVKVLKGRVILSYLNKNKVALVTGAASGIGDAIVHRLAREGARVAVVDIRLDAAERIVTSLKEDGKEALAIQADVADRASVDESVRMTVEHFGSIDIVVNSAGIAGRSMPIWEQTDEDWESVLSIDLSSVFYYCRAAIPHMKKQGWGRIVNIASIAGKEGNPNAVPYSAAKAGVIGLTKAVAKEVAKDGIIVNSVAPAVIATPLLGQVSEQHKQYMLERIPMGRAGETEEVAALVAWLSSDECSFSTGACYDISGGRATY